MKFIKKKLLKVVFGITFFLLVFPSQGYGWWNTGHLVAADITYRQLTPPTKKKVDELTKVLAPFYSPHGQTFVTSSTWCDEVRGSQRFSLFDFLHYTDKPYDPENILTESDYKVIEASIQNHDVVWAVTETKKILASPHANDLEKALALRLFIHLATDLHNPLHTISLYSQNTPQGDLGGNLFKIRGTPVPTLHKLWDSGCGRFLPVGSPPSVVELRNIQIRSLEITKKHPPKSFSEKNILDPKIWAEEGYQLGISHVYKIPFNSLVDKKYLMQGRYISERRIVLAGYRIARILNTIFDPESQKFKKKHTLIVQ